MDTSRYISKLTPSLARKFKRLVRLAFIEIAHTIAQEQKTIVLRVDRKEFTQIVRKISAVNVGKFLKAVKGREEYNGDWSGVFYTMLRNDYISHFIWERAESGYIILFLPEIQEFLEKGKILPVPCPASFTPPVNDKLPPGLKRRGGNYIQLLNEFVRKTKQAQKIFLQRKAWYEMMICVPLEHPLQYKGLNW